LIDDVESIFRHVRLHALSPSVDGLQRACHGLTGEGSVWNPSARETMGRIGRRGDAPMR
jgi:hypothetical protein